MAKSDWVSTSEAAEQLGFSARHLMRLKECRFLVQRIHWKNINPYAARPTYRWNVKAINRALEAKVDSPDS